MSTTVALPGALPGAGLRSLRLQAGLTLDALAAATGLDKGYLSRLERGLKGPSIATVLKLSAALDVPVSQLFGEELSHDAVRIGRAEQRRRNASFEVLTQTDGALAAFIVHLDGAGGQDGLLDHDGEELLLVLSGTIELRFADRGFVLEPGDCAQFAGHLPHRLRQIGERPASAMVAVARARARSRSKAL
jgi:transcriptional regulator with XRE-family HTH domain